MIVELKSLFPMEEENIAETYAPPEWQWRAPEAWRIQELGGLCVSCRNGRDETGMQFSGLTVGGTLSTPPILQKKKFAELSSAGSRRADPAAGNSGIGYSVGNMESFYNRVSDNMNMAENIAEDPGDTEAHRIVAAADQKSGKPFQSAAGAVSEKLPEKPEIGLFYDRPGDPEAGIPEIPGALSAENGMYAPDHTVVTENFMPDFSLTAENADMGKVFQIAGGNILENSRNSAGIILAAPSEKYWQENGIVEHDETLSGNSGQEILRDLLRQDELRQDELRQEGISDDAAVTELLSHLVDAAEKNNSLLGEIIDLLGEPETASGFTYN